ncbi:MAG: sigma-70 family RNA polymerase sigma factor [Sediminibacterium sp.]|nr:sigma-70 family RNA polymerase sigma factor [Sediminibacterium sp.]
MTNDVNTIWQQFHKELKAYIYTKIRHKQDTEDLLQDIFVKIIRNMDKITQSEQVHLYLYGLARNSIYDYFRKQKKNQPNEPVTAQFPDDTDTALNHVIGECCVKPFILKLPEPYKQAVLLTEFQNIPQHELAKQLGISYSGLKSRVQRGREKLKEMILKCCALESDAYGNLSGTEDSTNCNCS